ncbi:Mn-containing catalase [Endobacter medicaginis]|uniref:Manganese catalase family protein n=1 Tax=Endobacter medicaginis TaxID=1181271 RepID=A0A850NPR1_9PROT|nr:manganese catalase family protein [Endobacter medicaginis]MBB3175137.1 Mn-containing catalase [Endobacter medicaginis]MCX5476527.1 manganese catalase family protein [Endobacter medicaginis]NVN30894.1 manganese catalase family protein [Endobacter medicaginis]
MYYVDKRLQFPVKVETPDPFFARQLQQAIGGIEGEIRVCMQYFFQAWGSRGTTTKYRDMLLHTATEELGHIEMLATAVALNLEGAPATAQETAAKDSVVGTIMGGGNARATMEGMLQRHILSTGMAAFPANAEGVPFDMSHIYASGNLAADMYCNVAAESTGRVLAVRLYNAAHDQGMKDMLSFMIARDTMHQQQWLAVIEELGGEKATLPIPNSFDQSLENTEYSYKFFGSAADGTPPEAGRWTHGKSIDGNGTFSVFQNRPLGEEPSLGPAPPQSGAEKQQIA